MHTIKENESIENLWQKTIEECKKSILENVIINGEFDIEEINSNFIELKKDDASIWQQKNKPEELMINHGEYIYKGESKKLGIEFIIQELKNKNYGNRACYSLINMEDIVDSGDEAIPSFMILQFSFSKEDKDKLLVSAYFRALEVKEFLPINLSEICLNIREIKQYFPNIKKFELTIFAFRAQYINEFNCLRHSKLDILKPTTMVKYLMKDKTPIIEALKDKRRGIESVIVTRGIEHLMEAVNDVDDDDLNNKLTIQKQISNILETMKKIKIIRESTSIQGEIEKETGILKENISDLIKLMEVD